MLKKSPILFALAVFVLAVGWPITPVQAHCVDSGPHSGNHPHCRNAGDGPTNKAKYDVTVSGDLSSGTFVGRDGGGRSKPVLVQFQRGSDRKIRPHMVARIPPSIFRINR